MPHCVIDSPVGRLLLASDERGLCALRRVEAPVTEVPQEPVLQAAARQLGEYFAGQRRVFEMPLSLAGTAFQQACWHALCGIPYGETRTYAQQASAIGRPKAVRAVGGANHHNPVWIIVPCHRVIGADGSLTGYGGGIDMKEQLLKLERENR